MTRLKSSKILCCALSALLLASTGGCELASKLGGHTPTGQKAGQVVRSDSSKADTEKKNNKKDVIKNEAVLPTDREQIASGSAIKEFSPENLAKGLLEGDWAIETVYGKKAVGSTVPFLRFDPGRHYVYGNNGCNTLNADYTYNREDSTLIFTQVLTTTMICPDVEGITDTDITTAINQTRRYSWQREESRCYLRFYDANGMEVLMLMHQNFQFLNGTWHVIAINDEPVFEPNMKIVIDVDEHKVHGNTGCNTFNGQFLTDMEAPNSISFERIGMTMKLCRDNAWETPFVVALEEASTARPLSENKVLLLDNQGQAVLTLERSLP